MEALKNYIKEKRKLLHINQTELAALVGVRRETIIGLEKCRYTPSVRLALNLAKALHTTVEELFVPVSPAK